MTHPCMRPTCMQGPLHRCCSLLLRLFVSLSLLMLNRAKGLAGLMREGQIYIFWGTEKVQDFTKHENLGAG